MEISLEFCGGAESHNKGEKYTTINVDSAEESDVTLKDLFIMLRHNKMLDDVENLIESDSNVKPGVLVLINDADWELFDCANYVMGKKR